MNPRITIGLSVLLVVLVAVFLFGGGDQETGGPGATPTVEAPQLVAAGADQITRIGVRTGTQTLAAQRTEGGEWSYSPGAASPAVADQTRLNALASRLGGLSAQARVVDSPSDAQKTEFGLSPPDTEITVTAGGDAATLLVGGANPRRSAYYAQLSGAPAVYLVELLLVDDLKRLVTQPPDPPTPTPVPPTATPTMEMPAPTPDAAATPAP